MEMIIGYKSDDYINKRNIIGIIDNAKYIKVNDFFAILRSIPFQLNRIKGSDLFSIIDLENQFNDFDIHKVSLFHFINAISFGHTPWITTFETVLPRFNCTLTCHQGREPGYVLLKKETKVRKALEALSSEACKRIIAMSECSYRMQKDLLAHFPEYQENIESKLIVMHPPQMALFGDYSDKNLSIEGNIKLMFSGHSFFRKGGMEIIETLGKLKRQYNYDFTLTIVSSLILDTYATQETQDDIQRARNIIQENSDWIDYFPGLPYQQLLTLMKKTHVGLLPTYSDTYGYSALDFQAVGCPVVTTNVRAMPEINNNNNGWIIDVPKNRLGEAIYTTKEERRIISDLIREGLERIIHEIFSDRKVIIYKSQNAIVGLKEKNSFDDYARKLKEIYIEAIK